MKEKNSEKEQFFSKISHDLRGSFTSILGFSDILNDPNESLTIEEINEFTKRIQHQSKETFNLLVNFIYWLKLENYKYGLSFEKVELYDAFLETKNNLKRKIEEKNIEYKLSFSDNATVFMDYEILISVINNIFTFLLNVSARNTSFLIQCLEPNKSKVNLEITAYCDNEHLSILNNLNLQKLNDELSLPLIFALKFSELSGGALNFHIDKNKKMIISLDLPRA